MKNKFVALIEKQQSAKVAELNKRQSELIKQPSERTVPVVNVGDTVDVYFWIELGEKGRTPVFTGTIIAIKGAKPAELLHFRMVGQDDGVVRVFPTLLLRIARIDITDAVRVRLSTT